MGRTRRNRRSEAVAPDKRTRSAGSASRADGRTTTLPRWEPVQSTGDPIESTARHRTEALFGVSFDSVRIHTGAEAAASAHALRSRAYTVGEHVVFGADRYEPGAAEGNRLLAHELAHVVQQRRPGSASHSRLEAESDRASQSVAAGTSPTMGGGTTVGVQKAPLSDAELGALDREELEERREANEEESRILVLSPQVHDELVRERVTIERRLGIPGPVAERSKPRVPKKGVKAPAAADAFTGIDYELAVGSSLPEADTWNYYAGNKYFNVGRALRIAENGEVTTLYYAAAVKWEGFKGPQWIIGPESIDYFMSRADDFHRRTMAAPKDPESLWDWEREVHLAQMAIMSGEIKKALQHVGRSHVEKWSDDPIGTLLEVVPTGGGKRGPVRRTPKAPRVPKASSKKAGPAAKPSAPMPKPSQASTTGAPGPKPPSTPAPVSTPKPGVPSTLRESAGAAPPGTMEMTDPFTGRKGQVVATSKKPASQRTSTAASRAEFHAYDTALNRGKEIGLQRPGAVTQGGPDFITARRNAKGEIEVIVTDATINRAKVPKSSLPRKWRAEVDEAVAPDRLKLGDPKLEAEIRRAVKDGRVKLRTQMIETTPQGVTITEIH
ncbi:DUF4157 domain-containing protein [Nocardioides sp. GCM10028917]|uniref:eCIS core domain-containing protein n=1 Tax=Nocardioides sp. GCM10028917 TaxID=3273408 RepID=UPI00360FA6EB